MTTNDILVTLGAAAVLVAVTAFFIWQLLAWTWDRMADQESAAADRVTTWQLDVAYWTRVMHHSPNPARQRLAAQTLTFLWGTRPDEELANA